MNTEPGPGPLCFGDFELDIAAGELRRNTRRVKLQPQPFKLLVLLARRAGTLVTRDEIRGELWAAGTFVDFDQSVNFCVRQIRDALRDSADRPLYVETVPKRGYRFIAPVQTREAAVRSVPPLSDGSASVHLQKALWANIAELRMAERRRRRTLIAGVVLLGLAAGLIAILLATR